MSEMFKEGAHNLTGGEFASRADVDEIIISNCPKCGVRSFLQKDFEICPHCRDWDHEVIREVD